MALLPWQAVAQTPRRRSLRFMPLDKLNFHTFAAHLKSAFQVQTQDGSKVDLQLIEAEEHATHKLPQPGGAMYEQFSLVFAGPLQPQLPQQIYRFEHGHIGQFEMFMVPVLSRDPERMHYQCIFNRPARRPTKETSGK
jgi:hypothetical protein